MKPHVPKMTEANGSAQDDGQPSSVDKKTTELRSRLLQLIVTNEQTQRPERQFQGR